ncbi:MAG: aldo/keto reductase [Thermoplasmata archaeon]|nr:aldo/keto reductase [Thermoplasmata archaeon]
MPVLGLGTWQLPKGRTTQDAVRAALAAGYRLIDTATLYANEADVGRAIADSGLPREEVFITTKLWNDDHGFDSALRAFEKSRQALGVEQVDLYLIHWPVAERRLESWRALEQLQQEGRCRSIGVSNFGVGHLRELLAASSTVPSVNQVEFSPFLHQRELHQFCREHGIQLEAYSPLTRGRRLDDLGLAHLARDTGRTPAQVLLRWGLQHSIVEIPKSSRPERIAENARLFDFELSLAQMATLDALDAGYRTTRDPGEMP